MAISRFDELNNIKRRSLPFDIYFGEMGLTEAQKKERIELSNKLLIVFQNWLNLFATYLTIEYVSEDTLTSILENDYREAISDYVVIDKAFDTYIKLMCADMVVATIENADNPYYLSEDRAMFIAENEANTSLNYEELQEAIASGKTKKTWHTIKDKRVRHTHSSVNNKTIPIREYFNVGNAKMLYPKDIENAEDYPEEIVNCRCSISYH